MRQRTVSIEQVEGTLERWIQAANRGETVLITRGGSAVAALVGPPGEDGRPLADPVPLDPDLVELLGRGEDEEALRYLADC
jgi:antitoxin (DNA-binding transcriptional repressor) of toxin-antitoxin stability system